MTQKTLIYGGFIALGLLILSLGTFFTVDERETAFVLQFGELKTTYNDQGLKAKIPFIQEVVRYDKRLLNANLPAMEVTAGDQKRTVIDVFARYLIVDPVRFYKTVQDVNGANNRLNTIIARSMRRVIGQIPLTTLLSEERAKIMDKIHKEVKTAAADFGTDVKDVRIVRADLPKENSEEIFRRMVSERDREAKLQLAEGDKAAKEIRAKTDKKQTVIIAEAEKEAHLIKGSAEAKTTRMYAEAAMEDPDFYELYRSLQAYESALEKEISFVLSRNNKFFKHF